MEFEYFDNTKNSTIEETEGNLLISRIEVVDEFISNTFIGTEINLTNDIIDLEFKFSNREWKIGDKVTLRRNINSLDPVTFPDGLNEGGLYEIAALSSKDTIPIIKFKGADLISVGSGKIDVVN